MCRFCERPCDRDGGERPCSLSDAEFEEYANGEDDDDEYVGLDCHICGAAGGDCEHFTDEDDDAAPGASPSTGGHE